jgi:carbon-monoxide dehydrogenase medium subunit
VLVELVEPRSFEEAASKAAARGPEAEVIAGGTAVRLRMERGDLRPKALISLARIDGHDFIRRAGESLEIGALVRLRALERSDLVRRFSAALHHAVSVVGNVRVRHQAMLAGSLGAPTIAVDAPTMLLALDAELRLSDGSQVALASLLARSPWHLPPGKLITVVRVPAPPSSARAAYLRLTPRSAEARPTATVAAMVDFDGAGRCRALRLAVGGAVAVPLRLAAVEPLAHGYALSDELIGDVAAAAERAVTPWGLASEPDWYRREMVRVLVRRALTEVRDGAR